MNIKNLTTGAAVVSALCLSASSALAQDVKEGTGTGIKAATSGATEVTSDKMAARDKDGATAKDAAELSLSLGLLMADGNAKTQAYTGAEKYRLRRGENQVKQALAFNYARAAVDDGALQDTVRNLQGLLRYDRFLGDFTLFLSSQGRHDKFQGLDFRLQVDPGAAYYFINQKERSLWTEFGYDLTMDFRNQDAVDAAQSKAQSEGKDPQKIKETRTLHSARLFFGYDHALSDTSKMTLGLEYLQGIASNESQTANAYRVNFDAALTAKVFKALSMSTSYSLRLDSAAEQVGKKKTDQILAASLVYTFL